MFFNFNSLIKWLILIVSTFSMFGCGLKLAEKTPPPLESNFVAKENLKCLTRTLPYLNSFLKGEPEGEQVGEFWSCARTAMRVFSRYSAGDLGGDFSKESLRNFLQNYFMDSKLSDGMMIEGMRFKQIFLGGSAEVLTKSELAKADIVLEKLKIISESLFPYMKVYLGQWSPEVGFLSSGDAEYFEEAYARLHSAANELGGLFLKDSPDYYFDYLTNLFHEVDLLIGEDSTLGQFADQFIPLLKKVKVAIAGGNEDYLRSTEWKKFINLSFRGFGQFLRFKYFVRDSEGRTSRQVYYLARTLDDVISTLYDFIADKPDQVMTRAELLEILEKVSLIYPAFQISDSLLTEVMRLKKLFFGGSLSTWTLDELKKAKSRVETFRNLSLGLLPYLPVYELSWDKSKEPQAEGERYFEESFVQLRKGLADLDLIIEDDYNLDHVGVLTKELARLYPNEARLVDLDSQFQKLKPSLLKLKNLVVSGEDSVVRRGDWSRLFLQITPWYKLFAYYKLMFIPESGLFGKSDELLTLESLLDQALQVTFAVRKESPFSGRQLSGLYLALQESEIVTTRLSADGVSKFIDGLLGRFLTPREFQKNASSEFGLTQVRYALRLLHEWLALQVKFEAIFKIETGQLSRLDFLSYFKAELPRGENVGSELSRRVLAIFESPVPLNFRNSGEIVISQAVRNDAVPYSYRGVSLVNLYRVAAELVLNAYASEKYKDISKVYLGQAALDRFVLDVVPLMVELGLLSEFKETYGKSRLSEANLFAARSNGDETLSYFEGIDYIAMLGSGFVRDGKMKKSEELLSCSNALKGKTKWVDADCAFRYYLNQFEGFILGLSDLEQIYLSKNESQRQMHVNLVFNAAGVIPDGGQIKWGDLSLVANVIQYVEMIMSRFDVNGDGFLNNQESRRAYPVFKNLLASLSPVDGDKFLRALFTYMLAEGKAPETGREKRAVFKKAYFGDGEFFVKADRAQLLKILAVIQEKKTAD